MTMSDADKTQISRAFTLVARQFDLPNVDAQRMGMAFMATLDSLEPGQPVDLQSLFDFLVKEQRISQIDVLDFCIVLQSRQDKIGVVFQMPMHARDITPERIERVVNQFNKKTGGAAFEKKGPDAPAEAPVPGQPWEPSKKPPGKVNKGLLGALLVASAAAAGMFAYRQTNEDMVLKEVSPDTTWGGLACAKITANKDSAICDIPMSMWLPEKQLTIRAQASRMRESLANRGVVRVYVRLVENNKIVVSVP